MHTVYHLKVNLEPKWFWGFDYDTIDWDLSYKTVIARIIERGYQEQWEELDKFYGRPKVLYVLKNETIFLPPYVLKEVCAHYPIEKQELFCYAGKLLNSSVLPSATA